MKTPTRCFRTFVIAASVAAPALLSCCTSSASTHTLTEASARRMIIDSIAKTGDGYTIPLRPIAERIQGQMREDFAAGEYEEPDIRLQIQRLLGAGYISQSREDLRYKNVTGSYQAQPPGCGSGGADIGEQIYTFTLSMRPMFSDVSGQYTFDSWYRDRHQHSAGFRGPVRGEVSPDGILNVGHGANGESRQFQDHLRGQRHHALVGPMVFACGHGPMTVSGTGPGGEIVVPRFSYKFSDRLKPLLTTSGDLKAGKYKVDKVENLILQIDTIATAQYLWHVDLNEASVAIAGKPRVTGTSEITFRKQPDGTWILPNQP